MKQIRTLEEYPGIVGREPAYYLHVIPHLYARRVVQFVYVTEECK